MGVQLGSPTAVPPISFLPWRKISMKKDYTHIIVVLDKSGSMANKAGEVVMSFNKFLADQKELPGEATFSLVQFNHNVDCSPHQFFTLEKDINENSSHNFVNIQDAAPLTESDYRPTGWTALLDALGTTIDATGHALSRMKEECRPDKVIVCIITDGAENHSKEYTQLQIKEKIAVQQKKYNWQFVFIGAGIDTFTVAEQGLGIVMHCSMPASAIGARGMSATSEAVKSYRSGGADVLRSNYIKPKTIQ
jgi:hypothetical protein